MRRIKISAVSVCLIAITLVGSLFCFNYQAQAAKSGDYLYTVIDGKAFITKYTGPGGAVKIPSRLGGYPVISIGYQAFYQRSYDLISVEIPPGVQSIGREAFYQCYALSTVKMPNTIKNIGLCAFSHDSALKSINLEQGITNIDNEAFYGCTSLTSINLPSGLTNIGEIAFSDCTGLTGNLNIPKSVTNIGIMAFTRCTGLTSITFNSSTTTIEHNDPMYDPYTIPELKTIIGYSGSTAQKYAAKYGRPFQIIGSTGSSYSFDPRTKEPSTNDADFTTLNPFWLTDHSELGLGMPNCTCYAWGRALEIRGRDKPLPSGNITGFTGWAGNWWGETAIPTKGSAPALGAIACWGGHVAIVESIDSTGVWMSESSWGLQDSYGNIIPGTRWYWRYHHYLTSELTAENDFKGYIYIR